MPQELLIEQALYLPVEDLLNLCRTDQRFRQLCQDDRLWRAKIGQDFPGSQVAQIPDPREAYLQQIRDPRSIYHIGPDSQVELVSQALIPDDQLPDRVKQIAERFGSPYLVLYSRPVHTVSGPQLKPIAVQTPTTFDILVQGEVPRVTQVDILQSGIDGVEWLDRLLSLLHQLPPLIPGQQVTITTPDGVAHTITFRDVGQIKAEIRRVVNFLANRTLAVHQLAKTPTFQSKISQLRVFPRLIPRVGDLQQRKQRLIDQTQKIGFAEGLSGSNSFLGFQSEAEFRDFQRNYIDALNEAEIAVLEQLLDQILPRSAVYDQSSGSVSELSPNFAFSSTGMFVFVQPA